MSRQSVLKTVTLYKNNLGFYEREAAFQGGDVPSFELEIPLASKDLVVDTLRFAVEGYHQLILLLVFTHPNL
jgi:hypothetical protein